MMTGERTQYRHSEQNASFFDIRLEGKRVFVRPPMLGDYPKWFEVRGNNRDFLTPYEPIWPENCLDQVFFQKRLARQAKDWKADQGYCFLIFSNDDGALLGGININNVVRGAAQFASLGYWLSESAQGQGYMGEALQLIIEFSRDVLMLHRLNAACIPDNERSRKLLLAAGFSEEGYAAKYLEINGVWTDHRLFGFILDEDAVEQ